MMCTCLSTNHLGEHHLFPKTDLKHLFNHFDWNGGPFVAWNSHSFGIEGRVILKGVVHQGWGRADGRVLILAFKGFASDGVRLVIVDAPCERQSDLLEPQSTWAKSPKFDLKWGTRGKKKRVHPRVENKNGKKQTHPANPGTDPCKVDRGHIASTMSPEKIQHSFATHAALQEEVNQVRLTSEVGPKQSRFLSVTRLRVSANSHDHAMLMTLHGRLHEPIWHIWKEAEQQRAFVSLYSLNSVDSLDVVSPSPLTLWWRILYQHGQPGCRDSAGRSSAGSPDWEWRQSGLSCHR